MEPHQEDMQAPHEAPNEPPGLPRRIRRAHRKTRRGCQTCKRRRVRCDERQPLWYQTCLHCLVHALLIGCVICSTNCLTRGDPCVYDQPPELALQAESSARPSVQPDVTSEASSANALLVPTDVGKPIDPFETLEIDMPYRSLELFYHCKYSPDFFSSFLILFLGAP